MNSAEPDPPADGDHAADDSTTASGRSARTDPGGALDEIEDSTLDDSLRPSGRVDERDDDGTGAAFDVDLEPEDQGRADTGAEQTG